MSVELILASILAFIIGGIVSLLGAGGSILIMPVLVYVLGIPAQNAAPYSLGIVGIIAAFAAIVGLKKTTIDLSSLLHFSLPAMTSVMLMRSVVVPMLPLQYHILSLNFSLNVLSMVFFAVIMFIAAISMLRKKNNESIHHSPSTFALSYLGFTTGIITGFIGIGGGFIIVPILLHFTNMHVKQAISTSLFIIALNSLPGFALNLITMQSPNYTLLSLLSIAGILGSIIGITIHHKADQHILKKGFAYFILLMSIFILIKEIQ